MDPYLRIPPLLPEMKEMPASSEPYSYTLSPRGSFATSLMTSDIDRKIPLPVIVDVLEGEKEYDDQINTVQYGCLFGCHFRDC